jgi:hypothetical protein
MDINKVCGTNYHTVLEATLHIAKVVNNLRADLATARAEGAAAERAAVLAALHGGADTHTGIGSTVAAAVLRDHAAYIAAGAHVRPLE